MICLHQFINQSRVVHFSIHQHKGLTWAILYKKTSVRSPKWMAPFDSKSTTVLFFGMDDSGNWSTNFLRSRSTSSLVEIPPSYCSLMSYLNSENLETFIQQSRLSISNSLKITVSKIFVWLPKPCSSSRSISSLRIFTINKIVVFDILISVI